MIGRLVALLAVSTASMVVLSPGHAQSADDRDCAVYRAALAAAVPDSQAFLVADSTSLGVPQFAFHAWTGFEGRAGEEVPLTDSTFRALQQANEPSRALPACVASPRFRLTTVDAVAAHFEGDDDGWEAFRSANPETTGFLLLSRPLYLGAGDEALVYLARATDWLGGLGTVVYLRREADRWSVVGQADVWIS